MNKLGKALLVKFILTLVIGWISFQLFDNFTFGWVFSLAIVGTLINYIIGDLFILPAFGNITATIADGLVSSFIAYVMSSFSYYRTREDASSFVLFGVLMAIGEFFFHRYLINTRKLEFDRGVRADFSVEAGEEFDMMDNIETDRDNRNTTQDTQNTTINNDNGNNNNKFDNLMNNGKFDTVNDFNTGLSESQQVNVENNKDSNEETSSYNQNNFNNDNTYNYNNINNNIDVNNNDNNNNNTDTNNNDDNNNINY